MKNVFKGIIMAAIVASVAGFAGCAKDGDQAAKGEERKATLSIQLSNPTTRVVGAAPAAGTDNVISNFSIFVLDADGNATWKAFVDATTSESEEGTAFDIDDIATVPYIMEVTTSAANVYVIANAGDQTANYSTLTELNAAQVGLPAQYTSRWATGNTTSALTFADVSGVQTASANLTLKYIAARVTVKVVNQMKNYTGTGATVAINNVALMNARGSSLLFGSSLIPATYSPLTTQYVSGVANTGFTNSTLAASASVDNTNLLNAYSNANVGPVPDQTFHFYVFEAPTAATSAAFPTIVTLIATDNTAVGGGDAVYFPVHLAPYETWDAGTFAAGAGIVRGNSYDLTITLTGDAAISNGGGTDDPTDNVVNAQLNITLSITDWTPLAFSKEF